MLFFCVGPDCDRMDVTIRKWLDRCSQLTITTVIARPQAVAISWYALQNRTIFQEIPRR